MSFRAENEQNAKFRVLNSARAATNVLRALEGTAPLFPSKMDNGLSLFMAFALNFGKTRVQAMRKRSGFGGAHPGLEFDRTDSGRAVWSKVSLANEFQDIIAG